MAKKFCVQCFGPLVAGEISLETLRGALGEALSVEDALLALQATPEAPQALLATGVGVELARELEASLMGAGLSGEVHWFDEEAPEARERFVDRRVGARRVGTLFLGMSPEEAAAAAAVEAEKRGGKAKRGRRSTDM